MSANKALCFVIAAGMVLVSSGCSTAYGKLEESARASYVNLNYDQALLDVTKALRTKPDYKPAQTLLQDVYPKAIDSHLEAIKAAKASSGKFRWDGIVSEYDALWQANQAVKSLPTMTDPKTKAPIKFDLQDFTAPMAEARRNAAEEHYQEGRRLFGQTGIQVRDQAAAEFRKANSYVPGYKDATTLIAEGYYQEGVTLSKRQNAESQKQAAKAFAAAQEAMPGYKDAAAGYEKSRKAGITRIAIVPFDDKTGKLRRYGDVVETIVDGVTSAVMNDPSAREFLEIVNRDQLDRVIAEQKLGASGLIDQRTATKIGQIAGVNQIITGQLTQLIMTPERTTSTNVSQQARICEGYREVVDNKGKKHQVCNEQQIAAYVTIYHRVASVTLAGSYKVIDVRTGTLKETQQLAGSYQFSGDWATFSGDERALSGEPRRLSAVREQVAPVEEEMVNRASRDLLEKFASTLKAYAR